MAQHKSIEIDFISELKTKEVCIDEDLINTVLRNLLSNAIKFTRNNNSILVSCGETKDEIIISIQDNGIGISPENLNKLFRKDTHLTTYGTNKEKGTGLGLNMCKEFIDMHNGRIWV
ncbi:MAG: ATP-binding protein, partial [Bacteroidales bacterium]|nr:ATP-binding protein [Bacteroidales bacterium]